MKKENMLTYLESRLQATLTEYDFAIDWETKNHTVEVIVRIYAGNQENQSIEDSEGVLSEEEVIEFEDGVLFYNPAKADFDPEDYLTTFPYEGKKGLKKSFIHAFAIYLAEVLTEGESDLLDFLNDEELEVFELKWNEEAFNVVLAQQEKAIKTDEYVAYPSY